MSDINSSEGVHLTPTQVLLQKYPLKENPYVRMHAPKDTRRRVFGLKEKVLESSEAEVANLKLAAGLFREYVNRGTFDKDKFNVTIQKNIVRFLDRLDLPSQGRPKDHQLLAIKSMSQFYKGIFGDEYEFRKPGIFGEYSAMKALSDQLKRQFEQKYRNKPEDMPRIEYASSEEDSDAKVDFWVNLAGEGPGRVAVQVKSHFLKYPLEKYMYPLNSEEDINLLTVSLDQSIVDREKFRKGKDHFINNAEHLLNYVKETPSMSAAYLIVPSPGSPNPAYNQMNGIPVEEFSNKIFSELKSGFL